METTEISVPYKAGQHFKMVLRSSISTSSTSCFNPLQSGPTLQNSKVDIDDPEIQAKLFQSPTKRVNTSNNKLRSLAGQMLKAFQSPTNRVNTSNLDMSAADIEELPVAFQSPTKRVNTSNTVGGQFYFIGRVGFQSPTKRVNTSKGAAY